MILTRALSKQFFLSRRTSACAFESFAGLDDEGRHASRGLAETHPSRLGVGGEQDRDLRSKEQAGKWRPGTCFELAFFVGSPCLITEIQNKAQHGKASSLEVLQPSPCRLLLVTA